jgi:thiol-disulfide isomerase/thioredoxin
MRIKGFKMKLKTLFILLLLAISLNARGIVGQEAPSFSVDAWIQVNGKGSLDIENYKGKVLYLYGFQSWCPACHSHGFPTLNKLSKHYEKNNDVGFVAIQTTFEGYYINTQLAAKLIVKKYDLKMPVGQSNREVGKKNFMDNYNTGGTPWIILVDKKGIVRFSEFHATPEELISMIDVLRKE